MRQFRRPTSTQRLQKLGREMVTYESDPEEWQKQTNDEFIFHR